MKIYGNMSNGNGFCDFCTYKHNAIELIVDDEECFYIMNYFIFLVVRKCYVENFVSNKIIINYFDVKPLKKNLSYENFERCIHKLFDLGLITYDKFKQVQVFEITVL